MLLLKQSISLLEMGLISFVVDPWSEHCIINITTTWNCKVIGNLMCHTVTWKFQHRITYTILQFFFPTQLYKSRQTTRVGNRLEDSWLAHAHQKNYTNKYSLHFSHLIPPPLNQASRVIGTINFDENSCIISNNSIFLGKVVVVKKKSITFYFLIFFSTIVFFCYLLS